MTAIEFLRQKGLLKEGFTKWILQHPELGEVDLAEWLEEFGEIKQQEESERDIRDYRN